MSVSIDSSVLINRAIIMVTIYDDDDAVFAPMRAGARGYVLKGADQAEVRWLTFLGR